MFATFRRWHLVSATFTLLVVLAVSVFGPARTQASGQSSRPAASSPTKPAKTPTPMATATITSNATNTPTSKATSTPTATNTPTSTATPSPTVTNTPTSTGTGCSTPYLHTSGLRIVDACGNAVRLQAVNWYGFDSNDFVAAGLHYWSYKTIIARIKQLGFNAIRFQFSNEMVERNPVVSTLSSICNQGSCVPVPGTTNTPITGSYLLAAISDTVQSNSDLFGLDALHVLKAIADYAGSQGLYVILDNHRSQAAWGPQENGLWYTSTDCTGAAQYTCYTPQSWLNDWQTVGTLFGTDTNVVGMDLRNEPHWYNPSPSSTTGTNWQPYNCTAYVQYAHWGPCNGLNNANTDWPNWATQAGNKLLGINPHWLIFVEGGSTYPQDSSGTTFSQDGWGENLQGVPSDPITLTVANQLVYSPHDYKSYQTNDSVADMYNAWTRNFGFIPVPGHSYTTPLWVGEFGTCTDRNTCIMDSSPPPSGDEYGYWFNAFRFYEENECDTDPNDTSMTSCPPGTAPTYMGGPLGWSYWPANGTYSDSWSYQNNNWRSCYGQREGWGVEGGDWSTPSNQLLLQSLFQGPSTDPSSTLDSAPPPGGPWSSYTCTPYSG